MKLNDEEKAMLAGEAGIVAKTAIEHQIKVGTFFGAADFVPVTQAHIMADTESLGQAGVMWLERLADADEGGVRIPTITDPRGTDFEKAAMLGQAEWMLELERRAIEAFTRLGVSMTDTCINYQTVLAATRGEHVAFGDTGVVVYSNSVGGARSNFEGGPSALSAGLTGRTPRYGYHLDSHRQATMRIRTDWTPKSLDDWGALGGVVGKLSGNYWQVPLVEGLERAPTSDELKHFGAAMASFGSTALFHLLGITPEAQRLSDIGGDKLQVTQRIDESHIKALKKSYAVDSDIDVVVFSAPQLSLYELRDLAALCKGRTFKRPLLAITSPQVKPDCDRFGYTEQIESAGGSVLSGMCFYQSYAREMSETKGWKKLATNSAKLVNILGGYGYVPMLASMQECVQAAETGVLK
ncbi:aconitase X catalytic domain-containing protein [Comamonas testosteroni]|uniref:aconitase X catalytic domain-containing protein n=1 Tax=Comamonas testosteroni TaxID=285 RepID=UPI0026F03D5A|nr:aconitase X catalytic domain-containing protein [Comamonas testosteroni]